MEKRRTLTFLAMLAVIALGCAPEKETPTVTAVPTVVAPTETPTPTPPPVPDVPIYKNGFEDLADPAQGGITSDRNEIRINTENMAYQSGKQSLEATGTIEGPAYSALTLGLSVEELIGQPSIDLSNKTLGFSYFIAEGSPIDTIVLVAKSPGGEVNLASEGGYATGGPGREQGKWHYVQYDLKKVYDNNAWVWTALANADARNVVENCTEIMFAGMRISDGDATQTSFLIDDFKWIGIDDMNHFQVDDSVDSIRKYANQRGLKIGAVLWHTPVVDWYGDPWYLHTLAQEFNMTTVGGSSTPVDRPPDLSAVDFDYTYEDEKFAYTEGHGMFLRAGTGGWFAQNPQWLLDATYDDLKTFLERKIEQDVGHFTGEIFSWGVFNEVVDDDGRSLRNRQKRGLGDPPPDANAPYGYHFSPWVDGTDTSLIEDAFVTAHRVDPNAKLFLNDFNNEEFGNPKSDFLYNLLVQLKDKGVPVDGVGMQLHLIYPGTTHLENLQDYLDRVNRNIQRYAAAGLLVEFTEVECQIRLGDIDLATQAGRDEHARRVQKQADLYAGLMQLAVNNPNVLSFTFWTIADKPFTSAFENWLTDFVATDAFLFDKNYDPKPAYYAVLEVLKAGSE